MPSTVLRRLMQQAWLVRTQVRPPEVALAAAIMLEAMREGSHWVVDRSVSSARARTAAIANAQWWWLDDGRHGIGSAEACCGVMGWERATIAKVLRGEWEREGLLLARASRTSLVFVDQPHTRRALDQLTLAVVAAAWATIGIPPRRPRRPLAPPRPCPGLGAAPCPGAITGTQVTCRDCRAEKRRRANRVYWHKQRRRQVAGG